MPNFLNLLEKIMARITVEDCLENEHNRFALVQLAARRAKELLAGKETVADTRKNRQIVSALREIAAGKVRFQDDLTKSVSVFNREPKHDA